MFCRITDVRALSAVHGSSAGRGQIWLMADFWATFEAASLGLDSKRLAREQFHFDLRFAVLRKNIIVDGGGVKHWRRLDGQLIEPAAATPLDHLIGFEASAVGLGPERIAAHVKRVVSRVANQKSTMIAVAASVGTLTDQETAAIVAGRRAGLVAAINAATLDRKPWLVTQLQERLVRLDAMTMDAKLATFRREPTVGLTEQPEPLPQFAFDDEDSGQRAAAILAALGPLPVIWEAV